MRSAADAEKAGRPDAEQELNYVMEATAMTVKELDSSVPYRFCSGSPWTILCYTVEGQGSKSFDKAKGSASCQPEASHVTKNHRYHHPLLRATSVSADAVQP